jgi:MFS family permease
MNKREGRIFFGWWVVVACLLISTYISGVISYGFTTIIGPLVSEFGWSYTEISLAASLQSLIIGVSAPLVGILVDKWQPGKLILSGVVISCLGLILLSSISSLAMFYLAFILLSIGFGFTMGTAIMTAVVRWFNQNLAIATGIVACGFALGGLMIAPIALMVDTFGWRAAMATLGIGMLIIPLPLSLLIQRKPPQNLGRSNIILNHAPGNRDLRSIETRINPWYVLKNRAFWHLTLALTLQFLVINAVVVHIMPYLVSIGISRSESSLIASSMTVTGICGRLGFGWLGDRFNKNRAMTISLALLMLGITFFSFGNGGGLWLLVLFLVLFGIGWGGQVTMTSALIHEYFGSSKFGTIFGIFFCIMQLGGMAGPVLAGWIFDTYHSYQWAWLICSGLAFAAVIIMSRTPSPKTAKNHNGG